jgi:hypothetical protein
MERRRWKEALWMAFDFFQTLAIVGMILAAVILGVATIMTLVGVAYALAKVLLEWVGIL